MLSSKFDRIEGKYGTVFQTWGVNGLAPAIYSMRNPKDSWDKSDSEWQPNSETDILIGDADLKLAQDLIKGGACHRKFLRDVLVWVDITAPLYFWTELDTYKVSTVRNSCSTMHTLIKKLQALPPTEENREKILSLFAIEEPEYQNEFFFNTWRVMYHYLQNHDPKDNSTIRALKQYLPDGFLQRSMYMISYEGIRNVNKWRKTHRLGEWNHDWMQWVASLPYAQELLLCEGDD